jgi:hypothetical protein
MYKMYLGLFICLYLNLVQAQSVLENEKFFDRRICQGTPITVQDIARFMKPAQTSKKIAELNVYQRVRYCRESFDNCGSWNYENIELIQQNRNGYKYDEIFKINNIELMANITDKAPNFKLTVGFNIEKIGRYYSEMFGEKKYPEYPEYFSEKDSHLIQKRNENYIFDPLSDHFLKLNAGFGSFSTRIKFIKNYNPFEPVGFVNSDCAWFSQELKGKNAYGNFEELQVVMYGDIR